MKPLYVLVEGQTEEEFFKENLMPYFADREIFEVRPIKISTKVGFKGGFVKYDHLKRDTINLLKQRNNSIISTFVDYFRIPTSLPNYNDCLKIYNIDNRIECLETAIREDIGSDRFFPYIQKYEFEALLFSSNIGFENYYESKVAKETDKIIQQYPNPEEINDKPITSPSNRLLNIVPEYKKVLVGNIIALDIGIETILAKCPRFRNWVGTLIDLVQEQ
ncbi:MAG: DUF4276 family protein [Acidobacteriota bacterium]|nr:DUF4276 family protein [Acidobacteriota bacterium]